MEKRGNIDRPKVKEVNVPAAGSCSVIISNVTISLGPLKGGWPTNSCTHITPKCTRALSGYNGQHRKPPKMVWPALRHAPYHTILPPKHCCCVLAKSSKCKSFSQTKNAHAKKSQKCFRFHDTVLDIFGNDRTKSK